MWMTEYEALYGVILQVESRYNYFVRARSYNGEDEVEDCYNGILKKVEVYGSAVDRSGHSSCCRDGHVSFKHPWMLM